MNKTISITLNGIIFHIEEDGYKQLKDYLDSIQEHFSQTEGKEEIIADIENNIAEKFSSKISGKKKVITDRDVQEIIEIMGSVEEFAEEAENSLEEKENHKPVGDRPKRFYRDPDNAVLAGVCSGLGAYFNIDPVIFRVLFVVSFLFYGASVLAYIILWIAMPKAETSAQKLEMKGDSVTLRKIEENIKNKVRSPEVRSAPVNFLNAIFEMAGNFIRKLWPVMVVFTGSIIVATNILVLGVITFLLGVFLFNIDSAYINSEIPLRELVSNGEYYAGLLSSYIVIVIPTIFFLFIGFSLAKRKNLFTPLSTGIMVGIWMVCLLVLGLITTEVAPKIGEKVDRSMNEQAITANKELKNFDKILISDRNNINIRQGEQFQVTLSGRESDLENLVLKVNKDKLMIKEKPTNGLCLFCYERPVDINITMPVLEYLKTGRSSDVKIDGFDNEKIQIEAVGSSDVEARLLNKEQNIIMSDSADMELTGTSSDLTLSLHEFSEIKGTSLHTDNIRLDLNYRAKADLEGIAKKLIADLKDTSDLHAFNLKTQEAEVNVFDRAEAQINAATILESVTNEGKIYYKGDPLIKTPGEISEKLEKIGTSTPLNSN
jgi:phage shock protein PspC (stress-responsive transcriptional regulator)